MKVKKQIGYKCKECFQFFDSKKDYLQLVYHLKTTKHDVGIIYRELTEEEIEQDRKDYYKRYFAQMNSNSEERYGNVDV